VVAFDRGCSSGMGEASDVLSELDPTVTPPNAIIPKRSARREITSLGLRAALGLHSTIASRFRRSPAADPYW